ncbi:uncharacterized protein [Triticum aestivum]|uniref:uncharacterized protein n=1 Tax=Triticum aestivum TaxID=4565 RepID=UPI001D023259|nr:uncharacterized protein LOC123117567 [Triticum aestivum]
MGAPPPVIPDELVEEILISLPPDDPACLLRASLVCKDWGGIVSVSRPAFRRRLHELHQTPPWTGLRTPAQLHTHQSTIASSFSPAAPDHRSWRALDCRHGRVLFLSKGQDAEELLVWEPITGAQQRVPWHVAFEWSYSYLTAAVFCAADGCGHRDCLGGPFRVLFVLSVDDEEVFSDDDDAFRALASVYWSETGTWGELTWIYRDWSIFEFTYSSVLVGSSVIHFMFYTNYDLDYGGVSIMEYDLSRHALNVFTFRPPDGCIYNLVLAEDDGGLGIIQGLDPQLKLWTREASDGTDAQWVLNRVIDLGNLLPTSARLNEDYRVHVMGFAEGANAIFVNTVDGVFTIELQSDHARKVCSDHGFVNLIPVVSFYTPVPRGQQQNLLASKPSEEGGEEDKTVDRAQRLLSKGSNAMKEGDFVNTFECVSNNHNIRVPCYGEGALESANMLNKQGYALLPKVSSGDIPKSAPNEESVKGTTSKDDGVSSTTSHSNVEGAPASEKGESE